MATPYLVLIFAYRVRTCHRLNYQIHLLFIILTESSLAFLIINIEL